MVKKDSDSPFAVAEVGTRESFVEGLLVRLKVQDSDQCFLLQTARAVLGPGVWNRKNGDAEKRDDKLVIANHDDCARTASGKVKLVTATCLQIR